MWGAYHKSAIAATEANARINSQLDGENILTSNSIFLLF